MSLSLHFHGTPSQFNHKESIRETQTEGCSSKCLASTLQNRQSHEKKQNKNNKPKKQNKTKQNKERNCHRPKETN